MGIFGSLCRFNKILADIDPEKKLQFQNIIPNPSCRCNRSLRLKKRSLAVREYEDQQLHKVTNKGFKANEANEEIEEVFEDLENIIEAKWI